MKKILAILLALCITATGTCAFAEEATNKTTDKTEITYLASTNSGVDNSEWTVTVPATLNAGVEGDVTASGSWAPSHKLTVKADASVKLYINGNESADYAIVPVEYTEISLPGSYEKSVSTDTKVTVDPDNDMAQIKFGTWKGTLNFYINLEEIEGYASGLVLGIEGLRSQAELSAALPVGGDIVIASGKYTRVSALNNTESVNLTIYDGDFTEMHASAGATGNYVFGYFKKNDVINIKGGIYEGNFLAFNSDNITINIEGGTFNILQWVYADGGVWTVKITGGTFSLDPTQYLVEGYTATKGADDMWVVSKAAAAE